MESKGSTSPRLEHAYWLPFKWQILWNGLSINKLIKNHSTIVKPPMPQDMNICRLINSLYNFSFNTKWGWRLLIVSQELVKFCKQNRNY